MFAVVHHSGGHRTVCDPRISLQREDGAREPEKSLNMVSMSGKFQLCVVRFIHSI